MFYRICGLVLFLLNTSLTTAQLVDKKPTPNWVAPITYQESSEDQIIEDQGGYQYLLLDFQDHVAKEELFRHYAVKILNPDGVQAMSDISASYDPSYQKLSFHKVVIIRNGEIIDKLPGSKINTFQRETNMERSLYDGSKTGLINLSDVREGDILEYAYSIKGFNPIHKGNYSNIFYQEYTVPVNRIFSRILVDKGKKLNHKSFNNATAPKIDRSGAYLEYTWDHKGTDYFFYDSNVPVWIDRQKRVAVSTFTGWNEVIAWAESLYRYPKNNFNVIEDLDLADHPKNEQITQLIRFVQDDIRYLGLESGIGAYKPNLPSKVYHQRYGDCKDKSLLLVSLLNELDVEAYPLLVNTQLKKEIKEHLPSQGAFDHCIVYFTFEEEDYFIDPTLSGQGGNLENISFPSYSYGLPIKANTTDLLEIPSREKSTLSITETIRLDSVGGGAHVKIESEYTGAKADYMRSYFNSNSKESIKKEYANFYSVLYQEIEPMGDIIVNDGLRNSYNTLYIEENYQVKKLWSETDEGVLYFEAYPLVLESLITYPVSTKRTMPYYMGEPHSFKQKTVIHMPESWNISNEKKQINGAGFSYKSSVEGMGNVIRINHSYDLESETIAGEHVASLLKKNEEITNDLSFMISYDVSISGFKISWASLLILFFALGLGGFFLRKLYREYDPDPISVLEEKPIGGWLVLPAIGLVLTPIIVLFQIFSEELINQNTWSALYRSDTDYPVGLVMVYGFEQLYNYLYLMFSIVLILLFFNKRTSVPTLMIVFYSIGFAVPLVDHVLLELLAPRLTTSGDTQAAFKDISRSIVGAVIWIPYFLKSERVKETFVRKYKFETPPMVFDDTTVNTIKESNPSEDESRFMPK